MHYVYTNHLGSYNVITDAAGNVEEQLSFDACLPVRNEMKAGGRRRNATDWSYTNVPTTFLFDRGFTGHEHLDNFALINMNGRLYDPAIGRFLSPDNYTQSATTQGLNRYSYCLNNPLAYTDPSGYLAIGGGYYNGQDLAAINHQLQMESNDWFNNMQSYRSSFVYYGGSSIGIYDANNTYTSFGGNYGEGAQSGFGGLNEVLGGSTSFVNDLKCAAKLPLSAKISNINYNIKYGTIGFNYEYTKKNIHYKNNLKLISKRIVPNFLIEDNSNKTLFYLMLKYTPFPTAAVGEKGFKMPYLLSDKIEDENLSKMFMDCLDVLKFFLKDGDFKKSISIAQIGYSIYNGDLDKAIITGVEFIPKIGGYYIGGVLSYVLMPMNEVSKYPHGIDMVNPKTGEMIHYPAY